MKRVVIIGHRYQDNYDYDFHTTFEWSGSKYGVAEVTSRLTGLVINRNKQWKLKRLDHYYFTDTDLLIRGDVLFGLWWPLVRVGYYLNNQLYQGFKYKTLKFLMYKPFHFGYIEEGVQVRWKDLFKRKPK